MPHARKSLADRGKSIAKGKGKREGKNKVPGHRPHHPRPLSTSAGGTTQACEGEEVRGGQPRSCVLVRVSLLTHILLPRCKKAQSNHQRPTKAETELDLTFLPRASRHRSPICSRFHREHKKLLSVEPTTQATPPKTLVSCGRVWWPRAASLPRSTELLSWSFQDEPLASGCCDHPSPICSQWNREHKK